MAVTQIKDGFEGGSDNQLKVNDDGSINIVGGGSAHTIVTGTVSTTQDGLTAFKTSQFTVGMSAVQITPTPLANRSSISMRVIATGSNSIFIGNDNTVTILTGYPLYNGDTLQMDLTTASTIFAIATAGGQTMTVLEIA